MQVKGASVYSPYRLRPIVGIKLPLNATFSPFIYMHNPHTEAIQVSFFSQDTFMSCFLLLRIFYFPICIQTYLHLFINKIHV